MKPADRPDWADRTVVCIASGPSLTKEDCDRVRASGHPVVVTNTTFRMAPWADIVFGMDLAWWREHHREIEAVCSGRKMSTSHAAKAYGAESLFPCTWKPNALNSGAAAIQIGLVSGAAKVVLLGYDCQHTNGKKHWHPDHPNGLGNTGSIKRWPKHFKHIDAGGKVVNASRETALTCFPRVELEAAL